MWNILTDQKNKELCFCVRLIALEQLSKSSQFPFILRNTNCFLQQYLLMYNTNSAINALILL